MKESLGKNNPTLRAADLDNIGRGQLGKQRQNPDGTMAVDDNNRPIHNASTLGQMVSQNAASGVISESKMATMSSGDLKFAFDSARNSGNYAAMEKLTDTANKLLKNPQLSGNIQHNEGQIRAIASTPTPAYGPAAPPVYGPPAPPPAPPPGSRPGDV